MKLAEVIESHLVEILKRFPAMFVAVDIEDK